MPKVVYSSSFSSLPDAAAASASQRKTLVIDDDYTLTAPLVVGYHVLSVPGTTLSSPASPIVQVGADGQALNDLTLHFASLQRTGKKWADTLTPGADVGLKLLNVNRSEITFDAVSECSIGLLMTSSGQASGNNRVRGRLLWNNAIGFRASASNGGWVSELHLDVQQWLLGNALGIDLAGTVLCDIQVTNGNWRVSGNMEGDAAEYKVKMNGNNGVFDCRWEVSTGAARVHFGANAYGNVLVGHSVAGVQVSADYVNTRNRRDYSAADGARVSEPV